MDAFPDSLQFQDRLLQSDMGGGSLAAFLLEKEIKTYIRTLPSLSYGDIKIRVLIYLNVDGLKRKLYASHITPREEDYYDFVRQFNMHGHSFTMVDVGHGKEHADHRLREAFADHVDNPLCKHIIFAACHDKGYLPFLRQYQFEEDLKTRLTLLFTNSTQAEYKNMGEFPHVEFKSVFRDEPLPPKPTSPNVHNNVAKVNASGTNGHANHGALPTLPAANSPRTQPEAIVSNPPLRPPPGLGNVQQVPKAPVPVASPPPTGGSKWSNVATKGSKQSVIDITPKSTAANDPMRRTILLNDNLERLDAPISKPTVMDWEAYNAEKKRHDKNFCNNAYLSGSCHDVNCNYVHNVQLSGAAKLALAYMARRLVCNNRLACQEVTCCLGHSCLYGRKCDKVECRFSDEQHSVDLVSLFVPFRTFKQRYGANLI